VSDDARPWHAELEVTPEVARRLVAAAAPELAGARVERLGNGWDNTAYLVDGRIVFRFPRREVAVGFLENELRALPILADQLPMRVPRPLHVGQGGREYPWTHASYELLPGEVAAERTLDRSELVANAEPLARLLAALHAESVEAWRERGLPGDLIQRLDPAHRVPLARAKLDSLVRSRALADASWLRDVVEHGLRRAARSDTLVHGDLDSRHLLCDEQGRVCGVIDWGDVHIGDRAVDLALVWTFLPPSARPLFFATYGEIDAETWSAARFRGVHNSLHVLEWSLDVGSVALEASARQWLEHLASD